MQTKKTSHIELIEAQAAWRVYTKMDMPSVG